MQEYIEDDTPHSTSGRKRTYGREEVLQAVEMTIEQLKRRGICTADELALWETFPDIVRAHPTRNIVMDPYRAIKGYILSGEIGPSSSTHATAETNEN